MYYKCMYHKQNIFLKVALVKNKEENHQTLNYLSTFGSFSIVGGLAIHDWKN